MEARRTEERSRAEEDSGELGDMYIARRVGRSRSSTAEDDHENDGCESKQRSGLRI